ncbi:MAG: MFS transporter, partial [Novosphingobium sp.]|nr:MFS transporter [Novosphingobium sp.]
MATATKAGAGDERIRPTSWWMLAVLLLFYTLSLIDRGAISLLVVPIQADLGLDDIDMGIVLGPAFAISYAIFGLPMGWASDRFPRRWIIFIAIVVWSAAAAGTGFAWSFASLLVARILVGVGEAALSPIAYTLIADS